MKTDKRDRRSERTRRLLGEALIALMLERPYADLTVSDILNRADIGRSTFYAHYWDKDDLLASEIERMLDALTQQAASAPAASPALPPSLGLLQHIASHQRLYQALQRGGGLTVALRALRQRLCHDIERRLHAETALADIAITVTAQTVVGALLALIQWWLEHELPISAEMLNAEYLRLIAPGVRAITEP